MNKETSINESSLSRILSHVNSERDFAIFTAYRGIYSHNENKARNASLAADIKKLGYGFFHLDGYFIENMGKSDEKHVKEDSLFVISNGDPAFQKRIQEFNEKYNQEAWLLKADNKIYIIDTASREKNDLGNYHPGKISQFYSKLKTAHNGTFVFEGAREEKGNLAKYLDSVLAKK